MRNEGISSILMVGGASLQGQQPVSCRQLNLSRVRVPPSGEQGEEVFKVDWLGQGALGHDVQVGGWGS